MKPSTIIIALAPYFGVAIEEHKKAGLSGEEAFLAAMRDLHNTFHAAFPQFRHIGSGWNQLPVGAYDHLVEAIDTIGQS